MRKPFRLLAVGLTAAMMASAVTSCYKTAGNVEVISEDDPWYNVTSIEIDAGDNEEEFEDIYSEFVAAFDEYYVFCMTGIYKLPEGFDFNTDDYSDYEVERLDFFDLEGNLVRSISITDYTREHDFGDLIYVNSVNKVDEGLRLEIISYDMDDGSQKTYRCLVDLDDFTIGEPESIDDYEFVDRMAEDGSDEGTEYVGDYAIRKYWMYDADEPSYVLEIIDPDDNVTEIDLRDEFPMTPVYDISSIIDVGDNKGLICATYNSDNLFFELNFTTMTITDVTEDMSWFTCDTAGVRNVEGLGSVVMDDLELKTINYANHSVDPVFNFGDSNVNIYDVSTFSPISVTEDRAVFTGIIYPVDSAYGEGGKTMIYVFDKAETNPNAGKTVLEVAVIDEYTSALCSAVCLFNESNEEYFIRYNESYKIEGYVNDLYVSDDDSEDDADQQSADLGNRLSIDLMSGEGPDIIINGATFGMLNDDDYLLDLTEYASQNCGADNYFSSIIDAARVDDSLYQLPLSFSIGGIAVDPDDVEDGQIGFTFEQYSDFVEGPCNGTNPITGGKLQLFITALNCMQDLVITDGQVDYDNEAFRALAEYVSENVNNELVADDEEDYSDYTSDGPAFVEVGSLTSYYDYIVSTGRTLLGVPSYDGRGPIIYGTDSVAVSANSVSEEGCLEFVSILLGNEAQENFGMEGGIPVNRAAFDSVGHKLIDQQEAYVNELLRFYDESMLRMYGISTERMDEAAISDFASMIERLSCWYTNDGSINAIIREEMPAYFEGQKTLDQVIPILEDRVQTVLNERLG